MLAGPIFSREALTAPRKFRHFLLRSGYVVALFVLMYTTRQATIGFQDVRNVGDVSRFGSLVFSVFCMIQLSIVMFFALLFTAGNVAQEKDRQTLIMLLMTDLRDREMVLGKLGASLLVVGVLIAASIPVFCLLHILGGVSLAQVGWAIGICAVTGLAAGSWGALVAFWKEKTFQTLAISVLGVVAFLGVVEGIVLITGANSSVGSVVALFNPFRAMFGILNPLADPDVKVPAISAMAPVATLLGLAIALSLFTIARLRVWNPSRFAMIRNEEDTDGETRVKHRRIWNNPVIWREMRTRAYGRKVILIKLAYIAIAAFVGFYFAKSAVTGETSERIMGMISPQGFGFVGLGVISLMLINAQTVTSLTTERDTKTLDLLLCTDITAKEFVFGKLFGSLYNVKELILIPLILLGYFFAKRMVPSLTIENTIYVVFGFLVLVVFTAMLGLHAGLSHENSRSAIANSLGTIFFLFIGIFIFMILLVEARSSFVLQFQSFLVFIGVGSIALYASLTHKNPSAALTMAAGLLPFLTFYAITEFLLDGNLGVCMWISLAYGFTTVAMLVPAISSFDSALGRSTVDNG